LQSIVDSVTGLICSVVSFLAVPTIVLLLFRRFVPVLGDAVWRGYCQLLIWLVVAPIRLTRLLFREITSRR
jgi:hypothetical protein